MGGKDSNDLSNGFCWEVRYLRDCEGTLVQFYGGGCM